jgi:CspA family cold shock protein
MTSTTGTIKRITDKGFGFIEAPDGIEYFFHQSACTSTPFDSMREGDSVTFTVGQGPKGPRAENVNLAEQASFDSFEAAAPVATGHFGASLVSVSPPLLLAGLTPPPSPPLSHRAINSRACGPSPSFITPCAVSRHAARAA